jgi:Rubrerythrin
MKKLRLPMAVAAEGDAHAIDALTHAWLAEKQHRDKIGQIIAGSGMLFPLMAKKFEDSKFEYYVCMNCGSTLEKAEMPKDACPICGKPVSGYLKVPPRN